MRTLQLREIGVDDHLPIDESNVVFFDSSTTFGMFEQHYTKSGTVQYMYGDIADSLAEALELGGYVNVDHHTDDELSIPIEVDDSRLMKGTLWMYEHEYYPVLDTDFFPFQSWTYWTIAIKQDWLRAWLYKMDTHQMKDGGYVVDAIWRVYQVKFNERWFKVTWITVGNHTHLHGYSDIPVEEKECVE